MSVDRAESPASLFATGVIGTRSVSGAAEAVYQHLENVELARIYSKMLLKNKKAFGDVNQVPNQR